MRNSLLKYLRCTDLWHSILLLGLTLFSLRYVLVIPGTLGHTWDWEIPTFAEQIRDQISRFWFIWDYQFRGGFYSPYRPDGLYYLLSLPLAFFGGEIFTKVIVIFLLFVAASTMRHLAQGMLRLNPWCSTLAGILYMLSPVAYSRVVAGHMHILLPYSLLPLLFVFCWQSMQEYRMGNRLSRANAIGAGLILGLEGIHPSLLIMAVGIVALIILFNLVRSGVSMHRLLNLTFLFGIFLLVCIYWALPVGIGYITEGALFHSGWPPQLPEQVTSSSVVAQRLDVNRQAVQPMLESLRQNASASINTEFVYPAPNGTFGLWLLASFLLPIAAFAALLCRHPTEDVALVLALIGIIGVTLVAGANILTGAILSQWLMLHLFPVWAEYGNTVRALPLVTLSYSALAPLFLQHIMTRVGKPRHYIAAGVGLGLVLIYTSPFLSGFKLLDSSEPLLLRLYQSKFDERRVYDWLRKDGDDFRVAYAPPPWLYNAEYYDLGYEWMGGLSPHPEFFMPYSNPEAWRNAADFRLDIPASLSGKLLGLGAVKYILFPSDRFLDAASSTVPPLDLPTAKYAEYERFDARVLAHQKNLIPVTVPFTSTAVFLNTEYVPHIYAAGKSTLVAGNSDSLSAIADSSFFDHRPAIFFEGQQTADQLPRLAARVGRIVNPVPQVTNADPAEWTKKSSFLVPFGLLSESKAYFDTPQDARYIIRVQARPFRLALPDKEDILTATLEPNRPGKGANWSGNVLYDYGPTSGMQALQVEAWLNGSSQQDEFVQMDIPSEPIDLNRNPYLQLTSQVENTTVQAIVVQLNLDTDGDGVGDVVWSSPPLSRAALRTDSLNALEMVRQAFPKKSQFDVVGISVHFEKRHPEEWERTQFPHQLYTFTIKDLTLNPQASGDAAGHRVRLPSDPGEKQVAMLTHSLAESDIQNYPVSIEYQSDGPASLYAEMQVEAWNGNGQTRILPAGNLLIEPFSQGEITLDVRDQLDDQQTWRAVRAHMKLLSLRGKPELRPTTFKLLGAGAEWAPQPTESIQPAPPVVTVAGNPVGLEANQGEGENIWYRSLDIALAAGRHPLIAHFDDPKSAYRVDSVEIEPAGKQAAAEGIPTLQFSKINPTRYRVHVDSAQSPYWLVFSESFHSDWRGYVQPHDTPWYEPSALLTAMFDSKSRTELGEHYLVNGYANSWYVDKTGSYDIVIEFAPQRLYEGGWLVSLGTLTAGTLYLILTLWTRGRV